MNEKELLSQLNNLKDIKPDKEWKQKSREVLLSQISGGDYSLDLSGQPIGFKISYYFRTFFHQPVLVVTTILLIVLGGGIFSISASQNTKPGDSLYIAKIISEKAHLAITFNEESKAKLGIEFAGNRAKEITQVLAESGNGDKEAKVEKLARNFQKEISSVKTRLKKINDSVDNKTSEAVDVEEDTQVFSANLGRDDKGMQIYVQKKDNYNEQSGINEDIKFQEDIIITTPESITGASSTASISSDVKTTIEEAEKLFAEQDYDGTLDKLEEVIDQMGEVDEDGEVQGEVLGVSGGDDSNATSTEE